MKAIELLQYLKDGMDTGYPPKHIINNAIKEIEDLEAYKTNYQGAKRRLDSVVATLAVLQNENKSLVKTLIKMDEEMIKLRKENQDLKESNKELEDLQSRSCENCYESKTCKILHSVYKDRLKKEGYAMHKNEFKCGFWHSLF